MSRRVSLIRSLTILCFLLIPFNFNGWKTMIAGKALHEYVGIYRVDLTDLSSEELSALSIDMKQIGIKGASLMILGLNVPFLVCVFLATMIAVPRSNQTIGAYIEVYVLSVIIGLIFLPMGLPYLTSKYAEPHMAIFVSSVWWLLLGGSPIALALWSRKNYIENEEIKNLARLTHGVGHHN